MASILRTLIATIMHLQNSNNSFCLVVIINLVFMNEIPQRSQEFCCYIGRTLLNDPGGVTFPLADVSGDRTGPAVPETGTNLQKVMANGWFQ